LESETIYFRHKNLDVPGTRKDPPNGLSDFAGRKHAGSDLDLIEERLKGVIVHAVDDRYTNRAACERFSSIKAAEACAD
jgi:hypothetical protein